MVGAMGGQVNESGGLAAAERDGWRKIPIALIENEPQRDWPTLAPHYPAAPGFAIFEALGTTYDDIAGSDLLRRFPQPSPKYFPFL